jgi:hypothetical protein
MSKGEPTPAHTQRRGEAEAERCDGDTRGRRIAADARDAAEASVVAQRGHFAGDGYLVRGGLVLEVQPAFVGAQLVQLDVERPELASRDRGAVAHVAVRWFVRGPAEVESEVGGFEWHGAGVVDPKRDRAIAGLWFGVDAGTFERGGDVGRAQGGFARVLARGQRAFRAEKQEESGSDGAQRASQGGHWVFTSVGPRRLPGQATSKVLQVSGGNENAAINKLEALINDVSAQNGSHVTTRAADLLRRDTQYVIEHMP